MFSTFFAAKLKAMGYPHQDIHFALDYRVGDGVAFYGRIDADNLGRLANRLLCEQALHSFASNRAVIRKAVKLGTSFEIVRRAAANEDYANSMDVVAHPPEGVALTAYQQNVLGAFTEILRKDVAATSNVLTTLGYAIVNSMPAEDTIRRVIVRGDYVVLVKELPDPAFNPYATLEEIDARRVVDNLTYGTFRHYGLRVEIRPKMGGAVIGQASVQGVIEDVLGRGERSGHFGRVRGLMRDAVAQAREVEAKRRLRAA